MCLISLVDWYEIISGCVLEHYHQKNLFLCIWEEQISKFSPDIVEVFKRIFCHFRTENLDITFNHVEYIFWPFQTTKFSSFKRSLREKCPNAEFFLVYIFLYSDWIQENTDEKKLRIWALFTQWIKW